jgi:hypothetical protein
MYGRYHRRRPLWLSPLTRNCKPQGLLATKDLPNLVQSELTRKQFKNPCRTRLTAEGEVEGRVGLRDMVYDLGGELVERHGIVASDAFNALVDCVDLLCIERAFGDIQDTVCRHI